MKEFFKCIGFGLLIVLLSLAIVFLGTTIYDLFIIGTNTTGFMVLFITFAILFYLAIIVLILLLLGFIALSHKELTEEVTKSTAKCLELELELNEFKSAKKARYGNGD